jgi:hypothetical protein
VNNVAIFAPASARVAMLGTIFVKPSKNSRKADLSDDGTSLEG